MCNQEIEELLKEYIGMLNMLDISFCDSNKRPLSFMEYVSLRKGEGKPIYVDKYQWQAIKDRRYKEMLEQDKLNDIQKDF